MSEDATTLAAALSAAQQALQDPEKNKRAQLRGRSTYRYAGLDDLLRVVRPVLSAHGVAFSQTLDMVGDQVVMRTRLWVEGGDEVVSIYPMQWSGSHHDKGSEMTYARRYSLEAIVGVAATDESPMAPPEPAPPVRREPKAWESPHPHAAKAALARQAQPPEPKPAPPPAPEWPLATEDVGPYTWGLTDEEAADPDRLKKARGVWFGWLEERGVAHEDVKRYLASKGQVHPGRMRFRQRSSILTKLEQGTESRARFDKWLEDNPAPEQEKTSA